MKSFGKEYAFSILKVFLPDETIKQMKTLRKYWGAGNNQILIVSMVKAYYNDLEQAIQVLNSGNQQVGTESKGTVDGDSKSNTSL